MYASVFFYYDKVCRTIDPYKLVFKNPEIWNAYGYTLFRAIVGTILQLIVTCFYGYALSRPGLIWKKFFSTYIMITMLFSGGMVPSYILITQYLHLQDTIWVYILPGMISPWYVFMMRTFFKGIPGEISESAYIDGANEYTIFFKIIIPLSKPVIATVALMMFLQKWNTWMESMLYMEKENLMLLQYQLQRIMNNIKLLQDSQVDTSQLISAKDIPGETARMAMAVVAAGPALCIFPFFQKYFVKGVMLGSIKG